MKIACSFVRNTSSSAANCRSSKAQISSLSNCSAMSRIVVRISATLNGYRTILNNDSRHILHVQARRASNLLSRSQVELVYHLWTYIVSTTRLLLTPAPMLCWRQCSCSCVQCGKEQLTSRLCGSLDASPHRARSPFKTHNLPRTRRATS